MANLTESPIYEPGIFQLEKSTPPLGGAPVIDNGVPSAGHANAQAQQLANRTANHQLRLTQAESDIDQLQIDVGNSLTQSSASLTPSANKIPLANNSGLIADGWLSNAIARQADLSALSASVDAIKALSVNVKQYGAVGDGTTSDTAAVQSLVNTVASSGGGCVYFPRGNFVVTGLTVPANVFLCGAGVSATFLSYAGTTGVVGIDFTYRATSYNVGGIQGLTVYNTGSTASAAIRTAAIEDAFTKSQRWSFTDFAIRGVSGNLNNIIIGDSATSAIQRFFIQGPYVAQNTDTGQPQDVGILLKGVRGVVNTDISSYKMRGVRTAVQVSDYAEGFSLHDGEIVGSWDGVVVDSNPSKPGGFIYNNHTNCVHRGIKMDRRRHITIGDNQFYRDASFFPSGLGYRAIEATTCGGLKIGTVQTRIGVGFSDEGVGVSLVDTTDVVIESITGGETATLTKGISVTASAAGLSGGVTLKGISADTLPVWAEFIGPVNDFKLSDDINERGTAATTPILFSGAAAEKASIKLPRTSTAIPEYQLFANRNAALSKDVKARAHAPEFKESLVAGAGAYAVNYYFDIVSAVTGDTFTMRLTQIGGSNSTLNLFSGASTGSPASLLSLASAAAGTNQFRVFTLKFNGTAWELINNAVSLT